MAYNVCRSSGCRVTVSLAGTTIPEKRLVHPKIKVEKTPDFVLAPVRLTVKYF